MYTVCRIQGQEHTDNAKGCNTKAVTAGELGFQHCSQSKLHFPALTSNGMTERILVKADVMKADNSNFGT